jgi:hypothetical protein
MVKLTPEQQAEFMHDFPDVFSPCAGAWGRQGSTSANLPKVKKTVMERAVQAAWQNACAAAEKRSVSKSRKR